MPTYEYACKSCGLHVDAVQSFRDVDLTTCGACAGPLRKVFSAVGIAFKGSGFYKNDSRSSSGSNGRAKPDPAKADTAPSGKDGDRSGGSDRAKGDGAPSGGNGKPAAAKPGGESTSGSSSKTSPGSAAAAAT